MDLAAYPHQTLLDLLPEAFIAVDVATRAFSPPLISVGPLAGVPLTRTRSVRPGLLPMKLLSWLGSGFHTLCIPDCISNLTELIKCESM